MRLRLGNKHHLRKSADRKAQIRKALVPLTELICAFRSADFLRWCLFPKRNLTHNLFFYFQQFLVFGTFANRNSETSTETGRGRVRGAKQNGAFSRKSIRTFGSRALEPNKIFGSVQPGRFESAHVAMCFGSLGLQDAASTSALFVSSSVMSSIFEIVELYKRPFRLLQLQYVLQLRTPGYYETIDLSLGGCRDS